MNGPEQCDAGASNGVQCSPTYGTDCTYCTAQCTTAVVEGPKCGDGRINGNEQCDGTNTGTCSEGCNLNTCTCTNAPLPDTSVDNGLGNSNIPKMIIALSLIFFSVSFYVIGIGSEEKAYYGIRRMEYRIRKLFGRNR